MLHQALPDRGRLAIMPAPRDRPPVAVHPARLTPGDVRLVAQLLPDVRRRSCRGLADIELPGMIQVVRDVHSDARQLVMLLFAEQTQPAARDEQPLVPVDVEALVGVPATGSCRLPVLSGRQ